MKRTIKTGLFLMLAVIYFVACTPNDDIVLSPGSMLAINTGNVQGTIIKIQKNNTIVLGIAEVEVYEGYGTTASSQEISPATIQVYTNQLNEQLKITNAHGDMVDVYDNLGHPAHN
ncbi:MAG: hypothetical protein MI866_02020 [Bacteroidales bacterium]|nr:hypothetical protein [Bacteroidales bacterium]